MSAKRIDLGGENHRSPNADIVTFADAVLKKEPLPTSQCVREMRVQPQGDTWMVAAQAAVRFLFGSLRNMGIEDPSIAVLARTNDTIAKLSISFGGEHQWKAKTVLPIMHDVLWDADAATIAGQAVASIMEWPTRPWRTGAAHTLRLVADFHRIKLTDRVTKSATQAVNDFEAAATAVQAGRRISKKTPRVLAQVAEQQIILLGSPIEDWRAARAVLSAVPGMEEVVQVSKMIRLFRATDTLAGGLQEMWQSTGSYQGAADWLKATLERERIAEGHLPSKGCVLMNMHKSKSREFDAVVIVEPPFKPLISEKPKDEPESRRLLRMAITRARHRTLLVRSLVAPSLS